MHAYWAVIFWPLLSTLLYLHYFLRFYLNCKHSHGKSCLRNHEKVVILTQCICHLPPRYLCLGFQWDVDIKSEVEQNSKRDPKSVNLHGCFKTNSFHILIPTLVEIFYFPLRNNNKTTNNPVPQRNKKWWKQVPSDCMHNKTKAVSSTDLRFSAAHLNIHATVSMSFW